MIVTARANPIQSDLPFPAVWLRDNCRCAECRDSRNGQKFFGITDLAADLAIASVETLEPVDSEPGAIAVTFAPDGHRSVFDTAWLEAQRRPDAGDGRTETDKELWEAGDLSARQQEYIGDIRSSGEHLLKLVNDLLDLSSV